MVTILIMQANPRREDLDYLPLKDEYLKIDEALRIANAPEYRIVWETGLRLQDLSRVLRQYKPDIVHFSGHGEETGELLFEDNEGKASPITPQQLMNAFRRAAEADNENRVKLVVLNACFSVPQAKAMKAEVPVVIGTKTSIYDDSALRFSSLFYTELARGYSIQRVVDTVKTDEDLRKDGIERYLRVYNRAREGAKRIRLFRKPEIRAEFVQKRPTRNDAGEYAMWVYIENAPANITEVVYQYNHKDFRYKCFPIRLEDGSTFPCRIEAMGDIQIRASMWSRNNGQCLMSSLAQGLRLTYTKERNEKIKAAIQYIEEN